MAPVTSGFTSCDVGQQSLYQPPVSTTSSDPSASSMTSVGWKSWLSETRKSESFVVYVEPVGARTCRLTLRRLNWQQNRLLAYSGPNRSLSYRCSPQGAAGPRWVIGGISSGPVHGCSSRTPFGLP